MKTHKLSIRSKPFSINSMYYAHKAGKTQDAREWSYGVFEELGTESNLRAMREISESFDPSKHFFHVSLTAYYPKDKLYTKKGEVSARSIDTTNWEKPLIDLIFLPVHQNKDVPFGVQNIGWDDKYICSMSSRKVVGEDYLLDVRVRVLEIKNT